MQHMPKYYRDILEIEELQNAIDLQLDELDIMSNEVLKQFFIYTATWSLPIWERIFGLTVGDTTSNLKERRENIISKLRSYGTTTKEMIARVAKAFTNGEIEVIEDNPNYSFTIKFTSIVGIPDNLENFKKVVATIKPAHLNFNVEFRYNTHNQIGYLYQNSLKTKKHSELFDTRLYNDSDVVGKYHRFDEIGNLKHSELKTKTYNAIYDERR
nr:MAG TPA: tail protein [Caudoviricetes sp.]